MPGWKQKGQKLGRKSWKCKGQMALQLSLQCKLADMLLSQDYSGHWRFLRRRPWKFSLRKLRLMSQKTQCLRLLRKDYLYKRSKAHDHRIIIDHHWKSCSVLAHLRQCRSSSKLSHQHCTLMWYLSGPVAQRARYYTLSRQGSLCCWLQKTCFRWWAWTKNDLPICFTQSPRCMKRW